MLGADPATLDTEERRRLRNQRRRYIRRRRFRLRGLEVVAEKDPELHEELLRLRKENPQDYRQKLIRWLVANDLYEDRLYTSRELPADAAERPTRVPVGESED
jgi:hypothetical protein